MSIMTGVLRVSKESLFSDLNNVEVYSIVGFKVEIFMGVIEKSVIDALQSSLE